MYKDSPIVEYDSYISKEDVPSYVGPHGHTYIKYDSYSFALVTFGALD